ncbi:MAG: DUF4019 domain-containing protein [Bryobacteraceae bacterium]
MRQQFLRAALFFAALLCLSCNLTERVAEAKKGVERFHERLNSEQYSVIYAGADSMFRQQSSEKDFTAIVSAVHRKLGLVKQAEPGGWHVNTNANGTFVSLSYKTKFAEGDAVESFVWRVSGSEAKLVGYNINSAALITK